MWFPIIFPFPRSMSTTPFLGKVIFWASFYTFYHYSGRDERNRQKYPSYAIFKEKIIRDTWRDGFIYDKIQTDLGHYFRALKTELKLLLK